MAHTSILTHHLSDTGVLTLTLNDPSRRNALSEAMLKALGTAIKDAGPNPDVRVVVIAANGPAFSAGHDLKEMTVARAHDDKGHAYYTHVMATCAAMMQSIVACPKPVIAQVTGVATAAGCQLVASCDLAVAADTAKFSTPGVHIGLFCSTPMVALSRTISNKHAMEMLLTGDMIPADRAAEIGLINTSVPGANLTATVTAMAEKIASKSSMTLATGKQAFYAQSQMPLSDAYIYASSVMVENMLAQDAEEGINAFVEKRPAHWTDS